jgi:hypothetical protein
MAVFLMLLGLYYIDQPFAKVPEHGVFNIELRVGPEGAIISYFNVGIWDRFGLGVSYGGTNLLGAGNPEFYSIPGVQIRVLVVEEGAFYPLVQIGFDNQGYGRYNDRYDIRSKGLYGQLSKTVSLTKLGIIPSAAVNYCLESDNGLDVFIGLKIQFGTFSALLFEYTPNFNDPADENKGYLNAGLRLLFYGEMYFDVALRDILGNSPNDEQLNRLIRLGFEQGF